MFRKINITKWLKNEIHRTEVELLRAEDELANAQLRVKALQSRVSRLKGKVAKRPANESEPPCSPARVLKARAVLAAQKLANGGSRG